VVGVGPTTPCGLGDESFLGRFPSYLLGRVNSVYNLFRMDLSLAESEPTNDLKQIESLFYK
jgi:hypothetical protein